MIADVRAWRCPAAIAVIAVIASFTIVSAAPLAEQEYRGQVPSPLPRQANPIPKQSGRLGKPPAGLIPPLFLPAFTMDSGGRSPNDVNGPVAVADLNGDGKVDLVMVNPCGPDFPPICSGVLTVFLGNGDGTFQPGVSYGSGAFWAAWVAIADVNNDHKLDLVVANNAATQDNTGPGIISVLLGNGDGTFQPASGFFDSGGVTANAVTVGDLNKDGKLDVVVANNSNPDSGEGMIGVLLGNGDGTFQAPLSYDSGGWGAESVVLSDLNGDGYLDVVVSDVCTGTANSCTDPGVAGVLLGNGDGTLKPVVINSSGVSAEALDVAVGDLNRDGIPDLVVYDRDGEVSILKGKGDGTFKPAVSYATGSVSGTVGLLSIADFNGDGKLDIVATGDKEGGAGLVGILLGNGNGTFQTPTIYDTAGSTPYSVNTADLTGQHRSDVLVTECPTLGCGNGNGLIGILLHVGSTATTTHLISSLNPSVYGQPVTFTAAVNSLSGTPSGTVQFFDSSTLLGTETLANGSSFLTLPNLVAGSHSIGALYEGTTTYASSVSTPVNQVVNVATTTTALAASASQVRVLIPVTYTATVTSEAGGALTGSVVFTDGSTKYTVALQGNQAGTTLKYKVNSIHTVTAAYSGDSNNGVSASGPVTVDIQGASKTNLTTSGSPSLQGQPVTFTATVSSKYGQIPDGELVTFLDGKTVLASVPLSAGVATFTTSSLSVKKHPINADYPGDAIFTSSKGKVTQVVEAN